MEPGADQWAIAAAKIAIVIMTLVVIVVIVLNAGIAAKGAQEFTNTNMSAPFSALGFLAGVASLLVLLAVTVGALIVGRNTIARSFATVAAVEVILYTAMLVGYSNRSSGALLNLGQEKFFCELDCHIGYTVTGVLREGDMLRVTLRTHFDEHTIAPWRGDGTLTPNSRVVELVDSAGRVYAGHQSGGTPLETALRPGQSYTSEFLFTLPADVREPRLLVLSANKFPERILIGNENSFLHRKVAFRL